jgi:hypothetical protein
MIAFNRTASIAAGKTATAIAFAHEISAYMKEAYGLELEILLPIGGNPQRIAWSTRYKDLAAFDVVSSKLIADKHYWEIVGKSADNFIPGSMRDSIWRVL